MRQYSAWAMAALGAALGSVPATAATGSGSVQFEFLSFSGPVKSVSEFPDFNNPGQFVTFETNSRINGVAPTLTGESLPTGPGSPQSWKIGGTTFAPGTTSVAFGYDVFQPTDAAYNGISFAGAGFSNIAAGQEFTLGTITFDNGGWFGGGETSLSNVTSLLPFRIWTSSSDGPQFNQERFGIITLTVNALPGAPDYTIAANQDAEADWITVFMGDDPADSSSWIEVANFRVYDDCCKPGGFTSTGTVDLKGKFGSLILTGLANPQSGFIAANNDPLPFVPGGGGGGGGNPNPGIIPEPATWAMLISGFGLVGGMLRRQRRLAAA